MGNYCGSAATLSFKELASDRDGKDWLPNTSAAVILPGISLAREKKKLSPLFR
jgi:hypothetical protein